MVFSSITFLYYFLPITLAIYFIVPKKLKNAVLLLASLFFYFAGEYLYVWLLLFSSISDYLHSLAIEKYRGTKKQTYFFISSIIINLALLGYFKYADFFILNINNLLGTSIPLTKAVLPIGISFFTFQTMSYTIDVYRGRIKAQKNLLSFATFVSLFPQLVAGPIVRYSDIDGQLENRNHTIKQFSYGVERFVTGLAKKVILGNGMGELCKLFSESGENTVLFVWIYAIGFMLQIYFDFSGYSDMAIGLGSMFGFSFPENFNYPYISKSITEFWRRWHMTLSGWFKDYVYIPLGGNIVKKSRWIFNIAVVWFLTGLWHGAAWNFIFWGAYFGIILVVEKLFLNRFLDKVPSAVKRVYVLFIILISFIIFNAPSLGTAFTQIGMLFGSGTSGAISQLSFYYFKSYALLMVIAVIGSTPYPRKLAEKLIPEKAKIFIKPIWYGILLIICTAYIVDGSYNPFLYFRF